MMPAPKSNFDIDRTLDTSCVVHELEAANAELAARWEDAERRFREKHASGGGDPEGIRGLEDAETGYGGLGGVDAAEDAAEDADDPFVLRNPLAPAPPPADFYKDNGIEGGDDK